MARAETTRTGAPRPPTLDGLRVLAVAPTSFFSDYGCHVRILEETSALAERGVHATLVTYAFGRDLPGFEIRRTPRLPGQRRVDPGSSLHKLSMDALLTERALSVARDVNPGLIHGHLHEGALIAWSVSRVHRVPMVFDFQGSLTGEMIDHGFLTPNTLPFACVRRIETWIVDHADAIVTSTRHGADVLMHDFGCPSSRITVVPDAVNPDRFCPAWNGGPSPGDDPARPNQPGGFDEGPGISQERTADLRKHLGIPEGRPIVVYLGLLAEYQGITHLLHAAEKLLRDGEDLHFLVMGFPGEERYRALAHRLGIGERVTLTGAIRYEEAPHYLALGTLAVSPKLSSTEGNGKLLNYMAMGLPTVTFDTPVNREILGDLGIYAPFGDWSAMATEIAQALRDSAGSADRGRALRQRVLEAHTWKAAVDPLLAVYAQLLR